jgi:hypothetical protein
LLNLLHLFFHQVLLLLLQKLLHLHHQLFHLDYHHFLLDFLEMDLLEVNYLLHLFPQYNLHLLNLQLDHYYFHKFLHLRRLLK